MIRKGLRPGFRFGLDLPSSDTAYRRVLPFRRAWLPIGMLAAFDIVFMIPAVMTLQDAIRGWGNFDDLFDLVTVLFHTGWLLGWMTAPLLMSAVLAVMLFGREVLKVSPHKLEIFFGLPGIGGFAQYDVSKMRNLHIEHPEKKSGKSWRGSHLSFDYGANTGVLGSNLTAQDVADIAAAIQTASGQSPRTGEATDAELQEQWEPEVIPVVESAVDAVEPAAGLTLSSPSTLALIIANLVPLFGAVYLGWDLGVVMVLYWAESGIIGLFNIFKMIRVDKWLALMTVPFFIGHFGAFMAVHFMFIYSLFIQDPRSPSGGDLTEVANLFFSLWPALVALLISHGISYYRNFLGRREYLGKTTKNQMAEPYSRIVFMHMAVIFGGGLSLVLGEATPILMIVIAVKIWMDLKAHLKQRVSHKDR